MLLLPIDQLRHHCQEKLPNLITTETVTSSEKTDTKTDTCPRRMVKLRYRRLRHKKPVNMKLPTGDCKIEAKIDCWLNFKDYLKIKK